jgi:hypothetical protein
MAYRRQVQCITTDPIDGSITHIGGRYSGGTQWRVTSTEAIERIRTGEWEFYVARGRHEVDLIVATRQGTDYLRTHGDGIEKNNLASLPACTIHGGESNMAIRRQVQCVTRDMAEAAHRRITHIGGYLADGSRWREKSERAIRLIEFDMLEFFVAVGDHEVRVIIAEHDDTRYLKTETDGYEPDNLLSLPDCSIEKKR